MLEGKGRRRGIIRERERTNIYIYAIARLCTYIPVSCDGTGGNMIVLHLLKVIQVCYIAKRTSSVYSGLSNVSCGPLGQDLQDSPF